MSSPDEPAPAGDQAPVGIGRADGASGGTSVRTFLRRLIWRRDIGPLRATARMEVRELDTGSDDRGPQA